MNKLKLKWLQILVLPVLLAVVVMLIFVPWSAPIYPCGTIMFKETDEKTGEFFYPNGFLAYQGDWKQDTAHGRGYSFYFREWRLGRMKYSGQWEYGLPHGYGKLYCDRGALLYQGDLQQGLQHGHGEEYSSKGDLIYKGEWQYGHRHFKGQEFYDGSLIYHGEWRNGQRNGWGESYYPDGSLEYVGTWRNDHILRAEAIYLPDGTVLPPAKGYVYLWAVARGNTPEKALRFWQEASQLLEPHVIAVTDDPKEQAILYSFVELSDNYKGWNDPGGNYFVSNLHKSLVEILRLPPSVIDGLIDEGAKVRFIVGIVNEKPILHHELPVGGLAHPTLKLAAVLLNHPAPVKVTLHEIGHLVDFLVVSQTSIDTYAPT